MKKCNIVVIDLVPKVSQDLVLAASNSAWPKNCTAFMASSNMGAGARREGSRPPSSFLRLLLVWATAFSAAEWHGGAFVSAERDFAAWLARGVLHLPAQTISKGKLTVRLAEFECRRTAVSHTATVPIVRPAQRASGRPLSGAVRPACCRRCSP